MTIGIAVAGPRAGLAAFRALAAVEAVARGAVGGFVSFAAIAQDGALLRAETQRGGTRTLFTEGETTGTAPPADFAEARIAVLMSSGPDRPAPLSQFTPGDAAAGLITGHRLPNVPIPGGAALNLEVLARLREGATPQAALALLEAHPEADAGVIAVARDGTMALADTQRVRRRDDAGAILLHHPDPALTVGVLHNAIFPVAPLAALAAAAALDAAAPADRSDCEIVVNAGLPLTVATGNRVHVDAEGIAVAIEVDRPEWLGARFDGAAMLRGTPVCRDGTPIGRIVFEPYCVARDGRLVSMSGRTSIRVGVRRI